MHKLILTLLIAVFAVFAYADDVTDFSGITVTKKTTNVEKQSVAQVESDLDKILSGEEALPVLDREELAEEIHSRFSRFRSWLRQEEDALFTFMMASAISMLAGIGLALFVRYLVSRNEHQKHKLRWQFISALAGPVILMLVSAVIFLFLLPVLHSLPELYLFDARLFFTWLTLLTAWGGFQLITLFDTRMREFSKRTGNNLDGLMIDIIRKLMKVILVIATLLFIGQSIFQLNITTLLAGAGVVGLAVAFASRETLANFFGTLVIVLDRPFRIGDRIRAGDVNGIVLSVGMRSTRILSADESIISIPNNHIAEIAIENISNCGVIRHMFTLGMVYETSAEQMALAMKLLHGIADNFKGPDVPKYHPRIFFDGFGASSLNIRVIMWFKTTSFNMEEQLRTELNLEIIKQFNENGLSFAFNTVTNSLTGSIQLLPSQGQGPGSLNLSSIGGNEK